MPKAKQTTLVTFLLDRSGSMQAIKGDTIGGFNAYVDGLRMAPNVVFSFLQFDSMSLDTVCKNTPIKEVKNLTDETFQPRGSTPLIDACYATVEAVAEALAHREDKPKVVVCFQTDGEENCSRSHTFDQLNDLIKSKIADGWEFLFMGASIDAYQQATRMGIAVANTMSYDSHDTTATRHAFASSAVNTALYASGMNASTSYSAAQKAASGDQWAKAWEKADAKEKPKA